MKTKFAEIRISQIQKMNEENVRKSRKSTKVILRGTHVTRIKHGRDSGNFPKWSAMQY